MLETTEAHESKQKRIIIRRSPNQNHNIKGTQKQNRNIVETEKEHKRNIIEAQA